MGPAEEFLGLLRAGGEIVLARHCHPVEVAESRKRRRLFVGPDGTGYLYRPPTLLEKTLGDRVVLSDGRRGIVVSMRRTFDDGRLGWNLGVKLPDGEIVRAAAREVTKAED